jgi:FtsZ-interacting cell division protein YlmF
MLKAKDQAEVCRDLAPQILMGIQYATEDLQSEQWDGTISVSPPRPEAVTVDEILSDAAPAEPEQPETTETEETTEAPAQPVEAPVEPEVAAEGIPIPGPEEVAQVLAERDAADPEPIPDGLSETKVKQMFALLREGGIQAREDRLIIFRKLAEREAINSTNDLTTRDLNKIVAKLKSYSDAKTIVDDLAEIIWDAAQTEATAPVENNEEN